MNPDFLPDNTKTIFEKFSRLNFMKEFVLVGGSALSLQIEHRFSEDLDFIYDNEVLDKKKIKRNIHKFFSGNYKIIKEEENYQIDFLINNVKVTFFSKGAALIPFNVNKKSIKYHNINIAAINIIGVLKIAAINQRNTIRDYYDLYYIAKHHVSLEKIFALSKQLLPNLSPVTYSETIIYVDDIVENTMSTHLQSKEVITKQEIADFFVNELIKIKEKI